MLQIEAVEPRTLSLLKKLMQLPELERFALVGGTALALKYGHRTSIDIDLFFHEKFEHSIIIRALSDQFKEGFEYRGDNSA